MLLDTRISKLGRLLKNELIAGVVLIVGSGVIVYVISLLFNAAVSFANMLLLSLLILMLYRISLNAKVLEKILLTQQKPVKTYWDYRVYKVDENPTNRSPMISISNQNDVAELSKLGYQSLNNADGKLKILTLEKGMSMLNRIGWELIQVQRISEFQYYYIFRRSSELAIVI